MALKTFEIPSHNVYALRKKIAKLNRKALKMRASAIAMTEGEQFSKVFKVTNAGGYEEKHVVVMIPVTISGETPSYKGWTFVAALENVEGETVITAASSGLGARWQKADPSACDHCRINRYRTTTFILRHEDGTEKQVGRQCLRDFLGHESVADMANKAGLILEALRAGELGEETSFGGGGRPAYWDLGDYLAYVAAVIRLGGWVSRTAARDDNILSTADMAIQAMFPQNRNDEIEVAGEDRELAALSMEWAETFIDREGNSGYEHNVAVLAKLGTVSLKLAGYAASIVPGYARHLERIAREQTAGSSEWVGTLNTRQSFRLTLAHVAGYATDYGWTTVYKFRDEAGNTLVWKASRSQDLTIGTTYEVTGRIQKHAEYKGERQTYLTRCKIG